MDFHENIIYLAQTNSRKCYPLREEEIKKEIPYFELYENQLGALNIRCYGYEGHDNEPRMQLWENYMKSAILPNISNECNVAGFYNIELHDSYTYLKNGKDYNNVLTFSKFKNDKDPILIPDPYMICNWGNQFVNFHDHIPFDSKLDKVCFYGTTTGDRNPAKNVRIQTCAWALNHQKHYEFKITKVAQMSVQSIIDAYGLNIWKEIYLPRQVPIVEQLKYKYQLWVDGNTCRFDVWPFHTNSLILKTKSREMLWYYPLLKSGSEYVDVPHLEKLADIREFHKSNLHESRRITSNANQLAKYLCKPFIHSLYTTALFESFALNK